MKYLTDEPMSAHTTMRVGGCADRLIMIDTQEELTEQLAICRREGVPFVVIGRGSNLLVSDDGFRGTVICTVGGFCGIREEGPASIDAENGDGAAGSSGTPLRVSFWAEAGASLAAVAAWARDHELTGMEFAAGIPGTVGGGIRMNAGAYGGELGQVTVRVRVLTADGTVRDRTAEEMDFSYRHSVVQENGEIVLSALFALKRGERGAIAARMEELAEKRRDKQPLEYPSAGSTWKRPEGSFAAKLIEEAGCKGLSVGDAQISEKHAGFLINRGQANAADIRKLMAMVEQRVLDQSGVKLTPEIEMIGSF